LSEELVCLDLLLLHVPTRTFKPMLPEHGWELIPCTLVNMMLHFWLLVLCACFAVGPIQGVVQPDPLRHVTQPACDEHADHHEVRWVIVMHEITNEVRWVV
jgi:hypothetical protein